MINAKALILDVDGVILRHPRVLSKVSKRCSKYVANTLHVEPEMAESINKVLYQRFGHTLLGLERIYDMDIRYLATEFTEFVYDLSTLRHLERHANDETMLYLKKELKAVAKRCQHKGVPICILSNAPKEWCETVLDIMDVDSQEIIHGNHAVLRGALKPQPIVYRDVLDYMSSVYNDSNITLMYVDDSLHNLIPILDHPNWQPIHMNQMHFGSTRFTNISNLQELLPLI